MNEFLKKYWAKISGIGTLVTIITIIFTAGSFYQNYKSLVVAVDKERSDREKAVALLDKNLTDRIKYLERQTLIYLREYKNNLNNVNDELITVKKRGKRNTYKLDSLNNFLK